MILISMIESNDMNTKQKINKTLEKNIGFLEKSVGNLEKILGHLAFKAAVKAKNNRNQKKVSAEI
jgi:hypothetical protein